MTARDAAWSSVEFFRVLGPFAAVPVDAVRHALIALHAQRPTSRFVCRLDRQRGRWLPLSAAAFERWVDSLIVCGDPAMHADGWARTLQAEVLGDRPMVWVAGGRFGGYRASHTAADARVVDELLAEMLSAVLTGRPARYPFPRPARLPLARAFLHQFVAHPGRALAAMRIRRLPRPPAARAVVSKQDQTVGYASAASAPGALALLRGRRDAHSPGIAVSAVLLSAVHAAVRRHLGEPDPAGLVVLVDGRRYLPAGLAVEGNFVWGEHLRPASPDDPASVAAAMRELVQSRRMLTMLGLHNLRSMATRIGARRLAPPGAAATSEIAPHPHPHLTVTYLGRNDSFASLPKVPDEQTRMIGVVTPSGPRGITVAVDELDGALHVTASYHPGVFGHAQVVAATRAVVRDAVGAVEETDGGKSRRGG